MQRELTQRESDGIFVSLLWDDEDGRLTVTVSDCRTGEAFEVETQAADAMEVFHHPYAYRASWPAPAEGQVAVTRYSTIVSWVATATEP
jgi:hypothetical protein